MGSFIVRNYMTCRTCIHLGSNFISFLAWKNDSYCQIYFMTEINFKDLRFKEYIVIKNVYMANNDEWAQL